MSEVDLGGITVATSKPVLVTGATGYVAGWIVQALLDAGATVHAAVRDPDRKDKVQHLEEIASVSPGQLKLFAADLLAPGSYAEAMAGCGIVFHTASPFTRTYDDPQTELVDPAVQGTSNVLESVNQTSSVSRVVLTSSCAAMYTDAVECERLPGGKITEAIWNPTASLKHQPYNYSKTLAEKAAWKLADAQDRWQLVTVNPSLVIGPALNPNPTSESFAIMRQLGDGTMRFGAPRFGLGVVDVRDVARAHLAAAYLPEASGRYLCSGTNTDTLEMSRALLPRFGEDYPLPTRALPKPLIWLLGPIFGIDRAYVAGNVDHHFDADVARSIDELGVTYRPMDKPLEEMFAQLVAAGEVTPR